MAQFRDYMAGLRVDKYRMLADADRLFLNEFEGRFAEFSDFGGDEALLKASLVSYVQAEVSSIPSAYVWSFPSEQSTGAPSSSVGASSPTKTSAAAELAYA